MLGQPIQEPAQLVGRADMAFEPRLGTLLGRPVEAYVWTGMIERGHYFADAWSAYAPAQPVPDYLDWNLWRGPISASIS